MGEQDAITGNAMIPSNPGIAVQQAQAGAQSLAPPSAGAPPTVQVPAPVVPPVPVESYDFWSGVEQRVEPGQEPAFTPPAQAPAPVQPVVPVQVPTQTPAALPPSELDTALSFEQQAAIVEAGAAVAPEQPQVPAPAPAQDFNALEAQTIAHLARTEYALPQAEATRLVSEPEVAFPELAARLHVRLASQIGQAMQTILPGIINQVVDAKLKAHSLENDFFRSYPQLSDPRFKPVVAQSLRMARQASPQASREQIMNDGAALAALKLRLQLTNGGQQPVVVPQAPFVPQVAAQQAFVQPLPVQPFQPAAGGGAPLPTAPQEPANEFEVLAMDPNW